MGLHSQHVVKIVKRCRSNAPIKENRANRTFAGLPTGHTLTLYLEQSVKQINAWVLTDSIVWHRAKALKGLCLIVRSGKALISRTARGLPTSLGNHERRLAISRLQEAQFLERFN